MLHLFTKGDHAICTLVGAKELAIPKIGVHLKCYYLLKNFDPDNFRLISVVPVVEKVFEKIEAFQLNSYFDAAP